MRLAPRRYFPHLPRRKVLGIIAGGLAGLAAPGILRAQQIGGNLTLGLTPVFLTNDLELLSALKTYLETATGRSV
jgi:phosphonate transport system substrate-binding protein